MKKIILLIVMITINYQFASAQWYQIPLPEKSQCVLGVYFLNPDTGLINYYIYDSMPHSVFCKTYNKGKNWDLIISSDSFTGYKIYFDNLDTGIMGSRTMGILARTFNGCKNIHRIGGRFSRGIVELMPYKFNKGTYIAVFDSTYKTTNYGNSWVSVYPKTLNSIQFINKSKGYATFQWDNYSSILKTIDAGDSWTKIYTFKNQHIGKLNVLTEDTFFAIFKKINWDNTDSVYKTFDGGKTWLPIMNGLPFNGGTTSNYTDLYFADSRTGYLISGGNGYQAIYKTIDGGNSWHLQQDNFACWIYEFQAIDKNVLFVKPWENKNCIYYTINGGGPVDAIKEKKPMAATYSFYPNPALDRITVQCKGEIPCYANLYILDLQGKVVFQKEIKEAVNEIDLTALSKGIYMVKVVDEKGVWVSKVVKE